MNILKTSCLLIVLGLLVMLGCSGNRQSVDLPKQFRNHISRIEYGKLGNKPPEVQYNVLSDSLVKVALTWFLEDTLEQNDWQVNIFPKFTPDFHWAPHLTPSNDHIIAQHVFRAPALIVSSPQQQLTIIPDLDILKKESPVDWYMDLDAIEHKLTLGLSESKVEEHVLFRRDTGATYPPGKVEFGFYVMINNDTTEVSNPWRNTLSFFWENWGKPLYESGDPIEKGKLEPYVAHTYNWAFNTWKERVWQEFNLYGRPVGAPAFIINVTQSPNYPGLLDEREFRSIWNQAWFSSLRSAQGVYRYARKTNNKQLLNAALMTKELALSFPQKEGFFPALIATEMKITEKNGEKLNLSKGWDTFYFGNSNRNPYSWLAKESPYHLLDMSYTAYLGLA